MLNSIRDTGSIRGSALLLLTLACLAGSVYAQELVIIDPDTLLKAPLTFDSVRYKEDRRDLIIEHFRNDPYSDGMGVYYDNSILFESGLPQSFWTRVHNEKSVSEIYFGIEVITAGDFLTYGANTLFRAGPDFYLASWFATSYKGPDSAWGCDGESSPCVNYVRLAKSEVAAFLKHIDSSYKPLEQKSVTNRHCFGSNTRFAYVFVSYGERDNIFLVHSVHTSDFGDLKELKGFYDTLTVPCSRISRYDHLPRVRVTWDSILGLQFVPVSADSNKRK